MHLTIRKTKVIIMKIVKNKVNVNMERDEILAKIAEEKLFVNMVGDEIDAKIVEEKLIVNMERYELFAKIVEEKLIVNMERYVCGVVCGVVYTTTVGVLRARVCVSIDLSPDSTPRASLFFNKTNSPKSDLRSLLSLK